MLIGRSFDCWSDIINIPSRSFRHEKGSSTGGPLEDNNKTRMKLSGWGEFIA